MLPDCPGEMEVPGFAQEPRGETVPFVAAALGVPEPPLDRPAAEPEASVLLPLPVPPLSVELLQPPSTQPMAAAITPPDAGLPLTVGIQGTSNQTQEVTLFDPLPVLCSICLKCSPWAGPRCSFAKRISVLFRYKKGDLAHGKDFCIVG